MSMFKCLQNLESRISHQQSAGLGSVSIVPQSSDSNVRTPTPIIQQAPQPQPSSVDIQQRSVASQDPALDPGQARAGRDTVQLSQAEQTQRNSWKMRRDEDLYYLRTVEVRGFLSATYDLMIQDTRNSPYHWAKKNPWSRCK